MKPKSVEIFSSFLKKVLHPAELKKHIGNIRQSPTQSVTRLLIKNSFNG